MKRELLLILISFYSFDFLRIPVRAQSTNYRTCISADKKNSYFSDSIYHDNLGMINAYIRNNELQGRNNEYIPLVFHIVLNDDTDPITESQILEQIEVLNESFNAQNKDLAKLDDLFRPFVNYTGPKFCLAKKEENGNITKGIQFKTTDEEFIGELENLEGKRYIKYNFLGGFDAWDPEKYVNIWIGELSFAQGEATFPNSSSPEETGIVIDPDFFGIHDRNSSIYPFHLGKTLVHEMGHYFNLKHVWGDHESCDSDDGIDDTPIQSYIYRGCPSGRQITCGSEDMYKNFMNFTDDECLIHFTTGQMEHMEAAIDLFYPRLSSQDRCFSPIPENGTLENIEIIQNYDTKRIAFYTGAAISEEIEILLYQMDGKLVFREVIYHEAYEEINLNTLATGIYVLFLRTENNFKTLKLFVY